MNLNPGIYSNLLDLIGKTPLIKLNKIASNFRGNYYAKWEAFNPGHSNKDRIALHIIENLERQGKIDKTSTIIETTSGNTGFSLAMVAIIKGYKCVLAVNSKCSKDKINMLKALGAEVYVCPANVKADDPRSYHQVAKKLLSETKNSIYINQYFNELNVQAHFQTTGPEIWSQTEGKITHLVACSGTGGTISGCAKYLKKMNSSIKIIGVDAYGSVLKKYHETNELDPNEIYPYRIEGLGKNHIPSTTNFELIDEFVKVTDEKSAYMARSITKNEGIFVGYTSGATFEAIRLLNKKNKFSTKDNIVVIFPDHGSRYLSKIYSEKWMLEQGFNQHKFLEKQSKVEYI
tara:strand:- start:5 stop:1042 length:1038 start_codon:yes stop_codon:yes gene_type:complete